MPWSATSTLSDSYRLGEEVQLGMCHDEGWLLDHVLQWLTYVGAGFVCSRDLVVSSGMTSEGARCCVVS
jgi:hypothetical protein